MSSASTREPLALSCSAGRFIIMFAPDFSGILPDGRSTYRYVCHNCQRAHGGRANYWQTEALPDVVGEPTDEERAQEQGRLELMRQHARLHEDFAQWYESEMRDMGHELNPLPGVPG